MKYKTLMRSATRNYGYLLLAFIPACSMVYFDQVLPTGGHEIHDFSKLSSGVYYEEINNEYVSVKAGEDGVLYYNSFSILRDSIPPDSIPYVDFPLSKLIDTDTLRSLHNHYDSLQTPWFVRCDKSLLQLESGNQNTSDSNATNPQNDQVYLQYETTLSFNVKNNEYKNSDENFPNCKVIAKDGIIYMNLAEEDEEEKGKFRYTIVRLNPHDDLWDVKVSAVQSMSYFNAHKPEYDKFAQLDTFREGSFTTSYIMKGDNDAMEKLFADPNLFTAYRFRAIPGSVVTSGISAPDKTMWKWILLIAVLAIGIGVLFFTRKKTE
ncbi:MAG: hypothetical protein GC181_14230 [Bacteroidetes bacterium]|nr:hypothetical protein [Bacteroidota bacterium]